MTDAPWSAPVRLAEVQRVGTISRELVADGPARGRIARLLDLPALELLTAHVEVSPWMDGAVVRGRWSARLTQTCSLTADDFDSVLDGEFEVRCVPQGSPLAAASEAEVAVDPQADDPPDVLESGVIDLGGYVVEHLALELDPFPRKPGAAFEPPAEARTPHPFAALARLQADGDAKG